MCDYSLQSHKSRPAVVGERLETKRFTGGSSGLVESGGPNEVAVCVLPGTELKFDEPVRMAFGEQPAAFSLARFRQVNKDQELTHHDAIELPDGTLWMLNSLRPGQYATVLQLPAVPKTEAEAEEQKRLEVVG